MTRLATVLLSDTTVISCASQGCSYKAIEIGKPIAPFVSVHGRRNAMPEKRTIERALKDKREGKSASTQAGEFVREEIHHIREGKHGARSTEQAIAIGLSKARRAGIDLPAPKTANRSDAPENPEPLESRSKASRRALRREGHRAALPSSLAEHSRRVARRRGHENLSAAARKGARTRRQG